MSARLSERSVRMAVGVAMAMTIAVGACAPTEVVVASLDGPDASSPLPEAGVPATEAGADTGARPPGKPCSTNVDCGPTGYCAKTSCGATVGGCQPRPFDCEPSEAHVCGCDHVQYWNDCVRRHAGANLEATGDCAEGAECHDPNGGDCPPVPGVACARVVTSPADCPSITNGYCWGLPAPCPSSGNGPPQQPYLECGPPGGGNGNGGPCRNLCEAISTGLPYHAQPFCQ